MDISRSIYIYIYKITRSQRKMQDDLLHSIWRDIRIGLNLRHISSKYNPIITPDNTLKKLKGLFWINLLREMRIPSLSSLSNYSEKKALNSHINTDILALFSVFVSSLVCERIEDNIFLYQKYIFSSSRVLVWSTVNANRTA